MTSIDVNLVFNEDSSGSLSWKFNKSEISSAKLAILREHLEACVERIKSAFKVQQDQNFLKEIRKIRNANFQKIADNVLIGDDLDLDEPFELDEPFDSLDHEKG